MGKHLIFILKLILIGLLFYYILKDVDFDKTIVILKNTRLIYILFYIIFIWPLSLLLTSQRQIVLFNKISIHLKKTQSFIVAYISAFLNNFFPSGLGGDFYKYIYLRKEFKKGSSSIMGLLFYDKLFGLLMLLIFAMFGSIFVSSKLLPVQWPYIIIIFIAALLFSTAIIYFLVKRTNLFKRNIFKKIYELFELFKKISLVETIPFLILNYCLLNLLTALSYWFFFRAFSMEFSYFSLICIIPVISIVELLPISINGIGVREAFGLTVFKFYGLVPENIIALLLVFRVTGIFVSGIGSIFYLKPDYHLLLKRTSDQ